MKCFSHTGLRILGLLFVYGVITATPPVARAEVEKQNSEPGISVVAAQSGEREPGTPSSGVEERGIIQSPVGPRMGGTMAPPPLTINPTPWYCEPNTGVCHCFEKTDCDYLRTFGFCKMETHGDGTPCTHDCSCRIGGF